ncbi:TraG family conjugative transposon ATPase [Siphonobacter sp. SORGH_AS_1065]|uniref:TraG family conjugative transposon ATPase n=1 Tax=Siphonobacter sp. SORGH_AS_1065 TaxID=3041795 RepID=UPI002788BB6D|nr:TraG family conjugative transposon ATPase [Siphonobacter sp. SORGH_AS_1065]MDQ1090464.1 conjugation system TraG family ATPase [Siphonobacter sp. SORGH_AS_1065]
MKVKKIEDVMPILALENGMYVSKNADLTCAYELILPEVYTQAESDYDAMHDVFIRALSQLPVNTIVHKQDWYIEERYEPDYQQYRGSSLMISVSNERHFAERPFIKHKCLLFITRPMDRLQKRLSSATSLISPRMIPREYTHGDIDVKHREVCTQFVQALADSKLFQVRKLTDEEMDYSTSTTSILQNYLSLSLDDISITDLEIQDFKVGGKYCSVTTVSELEEFPNRLISNATIDKYTVGDYSIPSSLGYRVGLGLPFNHIYNQIFYIEDTPAFIKQLEKESNRMKSFAKYSDQNTYNMDIKKYFIQKQVELGQPVVRVHCNVLTWHPDREKMMEQRGQVNAAFSRSGFTARSAIQDAPSIYWSCIPGAAGEIGYDNLAALFVEESACLLALERNYNDLMYSNQGVRLADRDGKPLMVDIFMEPMNRQIISNRNAMIVGPSGSGKSFFANQLLHYHIEQGCHVMIVDTGNSYRRLCSQHSGVYITYDKSSPLSFNPFYFDGEFDLDDDTITSIIDLILTLWKAQDSDVKNASTVAVEKMVHGYYKYLAKQVDPEYPCFDSFFKYVTEGEFQKAYKFKKEDFDLENFKFIMDRFVSGSHFGHLMNADRNSMTNQLFREKFVVFELDNIKDNVTLFTTTSMIIMNLYVRKLLKLKKYEEEKGLKDIFKMLVIEEAWKALADPRFATFLKWVAKTARKHYGGLISVTQEPQDLQSELVKDAIINNAAVKILLDFRRYKNQSEVIQSLLGLSDEEIAGLLSVNMANDSKAGKYKEVFISWQGLWKVYRNEVSPEAYASYTTEKPDVSAIEQLVTERGSLEQAISAFARGERPRKQILQS